jgi:hypothetical protein
MSTKRRLFLLELNELNLQFIQRYAANGELPTFARLMNDCGLTETTSETDENQLEPWIQWVTAHTGLSAAEHGIFRLGDVVETELTQIWDVLEQKGLRVGALSPMNAKHQLRDPAFFLPDPWTRTEATAPPLVKRVYNVIAEAVNENAEGRLTPGKAAWLMLGLARFASIRNYPRYISLALTSRGRVWRKAIFLDLFLADLFAHLCRREDVQFATIFLNGAAHIQHHYLHSSAVSGSNASNPAWYCPPGSDPLLEVYKSYDGILAQLMRDFPDARFMVATGLHQEAHEEPVYYWRLRDHAGFLKSLGVVSKEVLPRMSRDFLVTFESRGDVERATTVLNSVRDLDGVPLFEIDDRGEDLFVTLSYPHDVPDDFQYLVGNSAHHGLRKEVAFVAIKNGKHDATGYFIDTGLTRDEAPERFPLTTLAQRVMEAAVA